MNLGGMINMNKIINVVAILDFFINLTVFVGSSPTLVSKVSNLVTRMAELLFNSLLFHPS
ncbi:hypothetical protein CDIV41_320190 [Carnobacterium divergens]|nr:hypothetical protein CDIV41_320190 [Carnobacterium divergens]